MLSREALTLLLNDIFPPVFMSLCRCWCFPLSPCRWFEYLHLRNYILITLGQQHRSTFRSGSEGSFSHLPLIGTVAALCSIVAEDFSALGKMNYGSKTGEAMFWRFQL